MYSDDIGKMVGATMVAIVNDTAEIIFTDTNGTMYNFYHCQDCCENVEVEDICGDLNDLLHSPILQAEESSSNDNPEGYEHDYEPESQTWTFYLFATIKGSVTVRWLGTSNGYYSESVKLIITEENHEY